MFAGVWSTLYPWDFHQAEFETGFRFREHENSGLVIVIACCWMDREVLSMKRRRVVSFLLTVMMLVSGIRFPIAKAEETYSTAGTLIETGRDNGYSGSNKVEKGNLHYGWSLGNFTISGFVRKETGAFGLTTFYVREGDTGFKLSYKLNYSLDKLAGKDTSYCSNTKIGVRPLICVDLKKADLLIDSEE